MRIKPGHGYYDVTSYPIGGSFHRAGDTGVELVSVEPQKLSSSKANYGCDSIGKTAAGRVVAFHSQNTDDAISKADGTHADAGHAAKAI